jgi:hypothetical protein
MKILLQNGRYRVKSSISNEFVIPPVPAGRSVARLFCFSSESRRKLARRRFSVDFPPSLFQVFLETLEKKITMQIERECFIMQG